MAAQELADIGEVVIEEADIVGDWSRPSFDVAASTIGVFDGDRLVAYGEVGRPTAATPPSHPDVPRPRHRHRARALDAGHRPRRRASTVIGMPVPAGLGRRPAARGARLPRPLGELGARSCPRAPTIPERDAARGLHRPRGRPVGVRGSAGRVQEDAFLEWSDRDRETFEDWQAEVDRASRLRAVEPARRGRPHRRGRRHGRRAAGATDDGVHRPARDHEGRSAAAASPRRCSSTRSRSAARTARAGPSCRPTPAPARSALYEKVGMVGRPRPGSTGPSRCELPASAVRCYRRVRCDGVSSTGEAAS